MKKVCAQISKDDDDDKMYRIYKQTNCVCIRMYRSHANVNETNVLLSSLLRASDAMLL